MDKEVSRFTDEPAAHALYNRMLATLREARSFYYKSQYRREAHGEPSPSATYQLWMKKPGYARVEATSEDRLRGVLVGDGENFWIYWPEGRPYWSFEDAEEHAKTRLHRYMKTDTPAQRYSLAHEIRSLGAGTGMTILEPSVFHGYRDPMDPYLDGVGDLGTETIDGEVCDQIEVSFMDHQRSKYLWLSRRDHLPRKLKEVIRVANEIVIHERWSNVTLDEEFPADPFAWRPPAGWQEWRPPRLEEGLLPRGATAPDFDLVGIDGSRLRLCDYRGKAVFLAFWRAG
jgi:outer membrane lipoprotein-sorting protein